MRRTIEAATAGECAPGMTREQKRVISASSLGTTFEWYDGGSTLHTVSYAGLAGAQIEIQTHQPGGKTSDERFFETDVWVHKGDAWKLGHVHFSAIPPK